VLSASRVSGEACTEPSSRRTGRTPVQPDLNPDSARRSEYVDLYGRIEAGLCSCAWLSDSQRRSGRPSPIPGRGRTSSPRWCRRRPRSPNLLSAAASALSTRFEQFKVTLSFRAVAVPDEANDPVEAMALADTRLLVRARDRIPRERRHTPANRAEWKPRGGDRDSSPLALPLSPRPESPQHTVDRRPVLSLVGVTPFSGVASIVLL
jgi:hypothetical protein